MAFNGHCKQGFFYEDQPYGKFVEYDLEGNEWAKQGIYEYENDCVAAAEIDDFVLNVTPHEM